MTDEAVKAPEGGNTPEGASGEQAVPYSRFAKQNAKLQTAMERIAALELAVKAAAPSVAPKAKTRAELQAAVDAGKISKDDAAAVWDEQQAEIIAERAAGTVLLDAQTKERRKAVNAYQDSIPELADDDSEAFRKVTSTLNRFIKDHGLPNNDATMLVALETVFGPIEQVRSTRPKPAEPFSELGSGGGSEEPAKGLKLTPGEKTGYEKMFRAGLYPGGWEQVRKEREAFPVSRPKRA